MIELAVTGIKNCDIMGPEINDAEADPMFKNLFNPNNPLMVTMGHITDCIFLSLFWLLGCFPVVTMGAAFAALYDASFRGFRRGEKNVWQRFGQVFRTNWKAGILPTAAVIGVFALIVAAMIKIWNAAVAQSISFGVFAGCAFTAIFLVGILSIVFPQLSRFENSFGALLKNSVLLGILNLPRTVALGILNAGTIFLCIRFVVPLFFLPSLSALIGSFLIEPMFKPYLPEDAA